MTARTSLRVHAVFGCNLSMSSPYGTAARRRRGDFRDHRFGLRVRHFIGREAGDRRRVADDFPAAPKREDQRVAVHAVRLDRQRASGREKSELGLRGDRHRRQGHKGNKVTKAARDAKAAQRTGCATEVTTDAAGPGDTNARATVVTSSIPPPLCVLCSPLCPLCAWWRARQRPSTNAWKTRTPSSRGSLLFAPGTSAGTKVLSTETRSSAISPVPSCAAVSGIFFSTRSLGLSASSATGCSLRLTCTC